MARLTTIQSEKADYEPAWEKVTSSSAKAELVTSIKKFLNNTKDLPAYYRLLATTILLEYGGKDLTNVKEGYYLHEANEALTGSKKLYKYGGDGEMVEELADRLSQTHAAVADFERRQWNNAVMRHLKQQGNL